MSNLKQKYTEEIAPALMKEMGVKNKLMVPKLTKIVVNMGLGIKDKDVAKKHVEELAKITGQKPSIRRASKSISNFKLREGMQVGAKVTLRGAMMYDFLDRLINATLPRVRDFRGISPRGFDRKGNFTLGIKEQTIFPEIDPNNVNETQGMDITMVTTARNDADALLLLKSLGMPFADKK